MVLAERCLQHLFGGTDKTAQGTRRAPARIKGEAANRLGGGERGLKLGTEVVLIPPRRVL